VNYTGYKNSGLVHKQQPADSAAPGRQVGAFGNSGNGKQMEN